MHRNVLFNCGHELEIRLYGNPMEILAQEKAILKHCPCQKCFFKTNSLFIPESVKELFSDARCEHLPEMTGSPKQIEWAMTLRFHMYHLYPDTVWSLCYNASYILGALPDYKRLLRKYFSKEHEQDDAWEWKHYLAWQDMIKRQTDSTWWIANRNNIGYGLPDAMFHEWFDADATASKLRRRNKALKKAEKKAKEQGMTLEDLRESQEDYWDLEHEMNGSEPLLASRNIIIY